MKRINQKNLIIFRYVIIMKITNLRVSIIIIATLTAINFTILDYLRPRHSQLVLTIEIILLPVIYIIGNYYIEELIKN
jgi:hypothetical protein